MKTWRDLEVAALTDPLIHAALHHCHPLRPSYLAASATEEMLINLMLALATERDSYRKQLLDRIEREPAHLIGV